MCIIQSKILLFMNIKKIHLKICRFFNWQLQIFQQNVVISSTFKLAIACKLICQICSKIFLMSQGSTVSIISMYRLDWGLFLSRVKDLFLASASRLGLEPTQPFIWWVPWVLITGVKHDQGVKLTIYTHLMLNSRMCRSCTSPSSPKDLYSM
jgi:hypothetical protein